MLQRHVSYHWTTSQYPDPKIEASSLEPLRPGLLHLVPADETLTP
jgi:hypothetical protein